MAKKETNQSEARQISYKDLIKAREEEMNRDILPGFMTAVKDPYSNRITNVRSKSRHELMRVENQS